MFVVERTTNLFELFSAPVHGVRGAAGPGVSLGRVRLSASVARGFALSPQGDLVLFRSAQGLYVAPADGSAPPRRIANDATGAILPDSDSVLDPNGLRFSPDGTRAFYVTNVPLHGIRSVPVDGSAPSVVVVEGEVDPFRFVVPIAPSPDGTWLVYRANHDRPKYDLYARRADGSGAPVKLSAPFTTGSVGGNASDFVTPTFLFAADGRVVYGADHVQAQVNELFSTPLP
jgi:hypothetical protein